MSVDRRRAGTAIYLPIVVFVSAAVAAICIGWLLHRVPHGTAPAAALVLVVLITAAGFIAAYMPERRR